MHTPRPWTIQTLPHQYSFRKGVSYAIRDARNCCLAEVGHVDAIHDGDESEANARLIASAPDMYAALEDLLAHLWDGRKRDVKKDYSLMVAEVAARKAMERAG